MGENNQSIVEKCYSSPIVIGGMGGSGTRLIASIIKKLGINIGSDLNGAYDNLWFTLLFKRADIFQVNEKELDELFNIFYLAMTSKHKFTNSQSKLIESLTVEDRKQHPSIWLRQRADSLLNRESAYSQVDSNWGWKEPNSHIIVEKLCSKFKNMKYIHVARNGLDMAYSTNQYQLEFWGHLYLKQNFKITPYYSLKYWCIIHKRILKLQSKLGSKFLFLNYDELCANPEIGLLKLIKFLNIGAHEVVTQGLLGLVIPPSTIGRFRNYNNDNFDDSDLKYVAKLGFETS